MTLRLTADQYRSMQGKPKRKYRHIEDALQMQVVFSLKRDFPNLLFCCVPNGGKRNKREAAKLKAMGVEDAIRILAKPTHEG